MSNLRSGTLRPCLHVSLLLLALAGCAYYNTFYLAKRYYREAQKAQEKSLSDAPTPEAVTKYDGVIRQCTKVITEYPKSKYVDDATYMLGAALYGKGDYSGAIKRLEELKTKFPKSPFVPEARLIQGLAHYRRKDYVTADSIFHEIDVAYPKLPRRWELYFYEGENKAAQKEVPAALWWYRRAVDAAEERRQRSDALRRAADALFNADRMDSAQILYAQTLKVEERPKQRLDLALRRGAALRDMKRYLEAYEFLNEWRAPALEEQREGDIQLRLYELQGFLGKPNEAIKGYRDLVERYANSSVAFEAQFQIGYLYESALNDFDQAAREYEKLRSAAGTNNEFAAQALRRSQSLATLKQFRQAIQADTTGAKARSAFRLAEVYYFELGKTDSALAQYLAVETNYPSSVYAPKSAYARLWIAAYDRGDTNGVMQLTDMIATRYRGTRYAESALYLWKLWSGTIDARTALFDSLLAKPDTSAAAQFIDEPEPEEPSAPATIAPQTAAPDTGATIPPEIYKKLKEAADAARLRLRKGSHAAPTPTAPADTSGVQAPSDSTATAPPAPAPQAPADSSGSSAPADTSRDIIIHPER